MSVVIISELHQVPVLYTAYIRRYEQVLSIKTVETLRHLCCLFVKKPLVWDFIIEALACMLALFTITVI